MENKTSKYFKYAIGEIILVVIGILIALQINNWNELRKERTEEKKILEEALLDMDINKRDIEDLIKTSESRLRDIKALNNHLIKKKPQYDSIGLHIREASSTQQFMPRTMGYNSLNAKGVDIIKNEKLRHIITRTYGLSFQNLIIEGREYEQFDNPTKDLLPYIKKHLVVDTKMKNIMEAKDVNYKFETFGLKVKDYEALLSDAEFILILQKSMFNRAKKIIIAKRVIVQVDQTIKQIKEELSNR